MSKKKIVVEYEEVSGEILDRNGVTVATYFDLRHFGEAKEADPEAKESCRVDDIIKLNKAGFSAEDIATLKQSGVI